VIGVLLAEQCRPCTVVDTQSRFFYSERMACGKFVTFYRSSLTAKRSRFSIFFRFFGGGQNLRPKNLYIELCTPNVSLKTESL